MEVLHIKIKEAQEKIEEVTELIYQKKEQEAYVFIHNLLGLFMELTDLVTKAIQEGEPIPYEEEPFKNSLLEAMGAMEQKDMILFADILQYEIKEQLQEWDIPKE